MKIAKIVLIFGADHKPILSIPELITMLNFNNFEYARLKSLANGEEKQTLLEELKHKFIHEVKESETCRNYFSKYDPESIDEFIVEYAKTKTEILGSYDYYLKLYDESVNENEEFILNARFVLNCILQKKLFNLQLQWRAEQIKIEEIQSSYEFTFWERNIEHCPFIPPVTTHELEVMKSFLQKNSFYSLRFIEWQSYDELMEKDEDGLYDNIPDWYDYYDGVFGTGQLLLLPDTRGVKEEFYLQIVRDENEKAREKENKNKPPQPPYVPKLYHWFNETFEFAMQCESDKYFKALLKLWHKRYYPEYKDKEYDNERVDEAIRTLEDADRPVMLSSSLVWHQAIIDGAERYETDKTLESLDAVYEEYMTLIDLGISNRFTPEEEAEARKTTYYAQTLEDMVLKGRQLNGEPRNFDF